MVVSATEEAARWSCAESSLGPPSRRDGALPRLPLFQRFLTRTAFSQRWLQTDFRQEYRWKVATAYHIARAVKAWHRASPADRPSHCVVVRAQIFFPKPWSPSSVESSAEPDTVPALAVKVPVSRAPSVSDAMEGVESTAAVVSTNAVTGGKASAEVVELDVEPDGEADADGDADGERELTGDVDADGDADADGEADDASVAGASGLGTPLKGKAEAGAGGNALQPLATNLSDAQRAQAASLQIQKAIALRAPLFELGRDATFIDPRAFSNPDDVLSHSLSDLFPELPLYSDADPLDKRYEESSAGAGRLTNVTRLLGAKPLLVSTLQPSRVRTRNGWDASTAALVDDTKEVAEQREIPAALCGAFFPCRSGSLWLLIDLLQFSSPAERPRRPPTPRSSRRRLPSPIPKDAPSRSTGVLRRTPSLSRCRSSMAQTGTSWRRSSTGRRRVLRPTTASPGTCTIAGVASSVR